MSNEIAELRAELDQLRQHMTAMQGATSAILHITVNALETVGVDRLRFVNSLKDSAAKGYAEKQTAEQTLACDLLMAFAQIISHPDPAPRPQFGVIDGGKQ